jgi:carbamoyltransferase
MNILGIAFLADASACVLKDGKVVSAISEERLNRVKLWNGIPKLAIQKALDLAGLTLDEIDLIATHGAAPSEPDMEPFRLKEEAILRSNLSEEKKQSQLGQLRSRLKHEQAVLGSRTPKYLDEIRALGKPVAVFGHHESHAASAYYGSGWGDCVVLTADGWGEDGSSTLWRCAGGTMTFLRRSNSIDSLGYFYGSITKSLGFLPHRHEGKVLGLAAHVQRPKSFPEIRGMVDYDPQTKRFVSRMEKGMYVPRFENPELTAFAKEFSREDIASSAQKTLEEVVCACVADLGSFGGRLAVAGGIFANVKLNQRLIELANVGQLFVYPNMGDGGLSVGAAYLAYAQKAGRRPEPLASLYLGPEPTEKEIATAVRASGLLYKHLPGRIELEIARLLAEGHIVARCSGPMEFGPRALGNRSILCQATEPEINDWLNKRLNRSEFMPFAPATLAEYAAERFIGYGKAALPARHMTTTFDCTPVMRKEAPAAVHIDGTARPQVVSKSDNPSFHAILTEYHRLTGRASVINTSFNMHEEPIICSIGDALRGFQAGRLPYLAAGDFLVQLDPVSAAVEVQR